MKNKLNLLLVFFSVVILLSCSKDEQVLPKKNTKTVTLSGSIGVSARVFEAKSNVTDTNTGKKSFDLNWRHDSWIFNQPSLKVFVIDANGNERYVEDVPGDKYKYIPSKNGMPPTVTITNLIVNYTATTDKVLFYLVDEDASSMQTPLGHASSLFLDRAISPVGDGANFHIVFKTEIPIRTIINRVSANQKTLSNEVFKPIGTMILFDIKNDSQSDITIPNFNNGVDGVSMSINSNCLRINDFYYFKSGKSIIPVTNPSFESFEFKLVAGVSDSGDVVIHPGDVSDIYGIYCLGLKKTGGTITFTFGANQWSYTHTVSNNFQESYDGKYVSMRVVKR